MSDPTKLPHEELCSAHRDMEGDICDLRNMATLCETMLNDVLRQRDPKSGYFTVFTLNDERIEGLEFVVTEVKHMICKFRSAYYEKFGEDVS